MSRVKVSYGSRYGVRRIKVSFILAYCVRYTHRILVLFRLRLPKPTSVSPLTRECGVEVWEKAIIRHATSAPLVRARYARGIIGISLSTEYLDGRFHITTRCLI